MSKICPKCGREYFGQSVTCIHCNCALVEKNTASAAQQQTGRTASVRINQQRVKQLEEMQMIGVQQPITKQANKNKSSNLGILAFILSLLGCTFWIGIVLAIIDLCQKNGKKKGFSIASVIICVLWIGIGIGASGNSALNNGHKNENSDTAISYEEPKQDDRYVEGEPGNERGESNYGDAENTYDNTQISAQVGTQYNAGLTTGQKNALASAESYLSWSSFSYEGLIKQLEFEKYSHEDAVYAVNHCGADWYEQAAKKAKSYLDYSSFSRDGLIEQLEFEGFTYDQAVYGAEQNGY